MKRIVAAFVAVLLMAGVASAQCKNGSCVAPPTVVQVKPKAQPDCACPVGKPCGCVGCVCAGCGCKACPGKVVAAAPTKFVKVRRGLFRWVVVPVK